MNGYQYRCAVTGNGSSVTSNAATLTVTPKQYTLTVVLNGGSGTTTSGKYAEGAVVQIDAGTRSNYRFTGWTSSNGGTFADASSASTTFTMPAADTTITANWAYSGGGRPHHLRHHRPRCGKTARCASAPAGHPGEPP